MKIGNLIVNIFDKIKTFLKKYPVTIIIILASTIGIAIFESIRTDVVKNILILALTCCTGTFLIEVFFSKKLPKIIGYVITLGIGILLTFIVECERRIATGYILVSFLISSYGIIKKEKIFFEDYLAKIFANIFKTTIIYLIVNIGITILIWVFTELIVNCGFGNLFIKAEIIMLGMLYIPSIIYSITDVKNKKINGFIKGLIKFVLLPLILIGMAIIYLYIAKIIILRRMPSNIIFRILSVMFIFAFPIWNMVKSVKGENKFLDKTTKILPYLYIPFIILEIISLGIRIFEYGITPIRCVGLAYVLIQIIALIFDIIKNGQLLSKIFIYMAAIIFVLFITPLNYKQISLYSQKHILTKYMKDNININEMSDEDKYKIIGAYKYIIVQFGKDSLPENFDESGLAKIVETNWYDDYYNDEYDYSYNNTIYFYENLQDVDIREYSKISVASVYNESGYGQSVERINLTEFINDVIEIDKEKQNVEEYVTNNRIQKVDENTDFIITSLNISYHEKNNAILYYMIEGYILEK